MNNEYYMDRYTDSLAEVRNYTCPNCGGLIEVMEYDNMEHIICDECKKEFTIYQLEG